MILSAALKFTQLTLQCARRFTWNIACAGMMVCIAGYQIMAVSYTHLDVYKRQMLTWKSALPKI